MLKHFGLQGLPVLILILGTISGRTNGKYNVKLYYISYFCGAVIH